MRDVPRLPHIAVSGGPASGKTTVLKRLKKRYGKRVVVLPEMATIFGRSGVPLHGLPREELLLLQRAIAMGQRALEIGACVAHAKGAELIICDRGVPDNIAYISGHHPDPAGFLADVLGETPEQMFGHYAAVLLLQVPPRDIYDVVKTKTNRTRKEDYEKAFALGLRTNEAWSPHGSARILENDNGMEGKVAEVFRFIDDFLAARP